MATGTIDKLWVQTINATRGHLSDVKLRYCVNHITPTCWNDDYTILRKFSGCIMSGYNVLKAAFEGPFSLQFQGSPKTLCQNSVKYRSWYFLFFSDSRYKFFSGFPPSS